VRWWFGRLLRDLRDAIDPSHDATTLDERIVAAADFAALYGLSHLARLHEDVERAPRDAGSEAYEAVHREVSWLTWQLRDLSDG
jgi:hypothetical protein